MHWCVSSYSHRSKLVLQVPALGCFRALSQKSTVFHAVSLHVFFVHEAPRIFDSMATTKEVTKKNVSKHLALFN